MDIRRSKDIVGLKLSSGELVGFHARNLEIAELDSDSFEALHPVDFISSGQWIDSTHSQTEAAHEILTWNAQESHGASDVLTSRKINTFSINVSQLCNLKCTYCAAGGDGTYGSPVKKADLNKVQTQLSWLLSRHQAEDGEFFVHFLGGEPLLYPDLIKSIYNHTELLVAGRNIKVRYSVTTNGTLINEKAIKILCDMSADMTISFDGPPEINERVRPSVGKASSSKKTLSGIELVTKHRHQLGSVGVNAVFGEHNNEVLKCYQYLRSLPINWDYYNLNFANNDKDATVTKAYLSQLELVAEDAFQSGGLTELSKIAQFRSTLIRLESQTRLQSYCGAGKSLLQTNTQGDLYTCNWFMNDKDEKVGHLKSIESSNWNQYSKELIELQNCQTCWNRYICAGGCMAAHKLQTGNRHVKDELFCLRSRSLSALAIGYYFLTLTREVKNEVC